MVVTNIWWLQYESLEWMYIKIKKIIDSNILIVILEIIFRFRRELRSLIEDFITVRLIQI